MTSQLDRSFNALAVSQKLGRRTVNAAAALLFALLPSFSFAQSDDDDTRLLSVRCEYSDNPDNEVETVQIDATAPASADAAATKTFRKGERWQSASYRVNVGEAAECVFPSGHKVRAKVGQGTSSGFGQCGGDPEVFLSVWVNERKIASKVWFSGHCAEQDGVPDVSLRFSGGHDIKVEKCNSLPPKAANTAAGDAKSTASEALSVCVDYPAVESYPRDEIEYPPPGQKPAAPGTIALISGSHKVCAAAQEELNADFNTFGQYSDQTTFKLSRPNWAAASQEQFDNALLPEIAAGEQSIFDFDNDGKLDRVTRMRFATHYMDAQTLLVESGRSSKKLQVPDGPSNQHRWFLPCQMSQTHYALADCPPYSQKFDEAGFWMGTNDKPETVYFLSRYSSLSPFAFKGESYIGVSGQGQAEDFVAIIKPMPKQTFQRMCLLRQIRENF